MSKVIHPPSEDRNPYFLECSGVDVQQQLLPAMIKDKLLDTSNHPKGQQICSTKFTNRIGKFNDESCSVCTELFLRPKCHSLLSSSCNVFNE